MTDSLLLDDGLQRANPAARTLPRRERRSRWLSAAVLLAPSLAFLALFTYWPVLRVLAESLLVGRFAGQSGLGFDNYRRLFSDPHFTTAALNNLVYALGTIVAAQKSANALLRPYVEQTALKPIA